MKAESLWVILIVAVATLISRASFDPSLSADFQALWIAAEFYHAEVFDQIYPPLTETFTSDPSPEWIAHIAAQGQESALFSYIYPPIWAAAISPLTQITTFETVAEVASYLNPVLIGAMVFLAWRICILSGLQVLRASVFVLLGLVLIFGTTVGTIALFQNQIQIFVSFLIVLGLEREKSRSPVWAGAAMGLAAAIKLYPVLIAIFWLAQGKKNPFASFILVGGSLGSLSVVVCGWSLHSLFLQQINLISDTILLSGINYSFESTIANFFAQDQMKFTPWATNVLTQDLSGGNLSMLKTALWQVASMLVVLGSIVGMAWLARKYRDADPVAFWPFALTLISLLSPLAWSHHFLPALSFAPALIAYLGMRSGARMLAIICIPLMMGLLPTYDKVTTVIDLQQLVGFLCLSLYCGTWYMLLFKGPIKDQIQK